MVSITVGETSVEAATLKEANKLAKKLERKLRKEETIKTANRSVASNLAHATIGRLCCTAWDTFNRNGTLPCGYKAYSASDQYSCKVTIKGKETTLHTQSEVSHFDWSAYGYAITHELINGGGFHCAARCVNGTETYWVSLGEYDGQISCIMLPSILNTVLESMI